MLFRKWQIHPVGSKGQIKEKHLFQYTKYNEAVSKNKKTSFFESG